MISINLATEDDFNFFYKIKKNKDNMYWSGYSKEPNKERLKDFFYNTIHSQNDTNKRKIYIVKFKDSKCGYLYFDPIDVKNVMISVAILDVFSGKGIGKLAVKNLIDIAFQNGIKKIIAEIREDNIRSKKLFTSIEFAETKEFRLMKIENMNKEIKMIRFEKNNNKIETESLSTKDI